MCKMEKSHCKELEDILNSSPRFFERYGIMIMISLLSVSIFIVSHFEHIEHNKVISLTKYKDIYKANIVMKSGNNTYESFLIEQYFLLYDEKDKVKCETYSLLRNDKTNTATLTFKPINISDTLIINRIAGNTDKDSITIELGQRYFSIIMDPVLKSLKRYYKSK